MPTRGPSPPTSPAPASGRPPPSPVGSSLTSSCPTRQCARQHDRMKRSWIFTRACTPRLPTSLAGIVPRSTGLRPSGPDRACHVKYLGVLLLAIAFGLLTALSVLSLRSQRGVKCPDHVVIIRGRETGPVECVCIDGRLATCFPPGR